MTNVAVQIRDERIQYWLLQYLPHKRPEIQLFDSVPAFIWDDGHYVLKIKVHQAKADQEPGWMSHTGTLKTHAGFIVRSCLMNENSDILECLGRQAYAMVYDVDVESEAFRKHEQALCREIKEKVQEEFPWYNMYVSPGGDDPSALFVNVFNVDDKAEEDRIEEYVHALSDEYMNELGGGFMIGSIIRDSETTDKYYPEYSIHPNNIHEAWVTILEELHEVMDQPHILKAKNMVSKRLVTNYEEGKNE